MVILNSCCYFKSVRRGSYASIIYTLTYHSFSSILFAAYVIEERHFLVGKQNVPIGESLLEGGVVTPVVVIFNLLSLCCSISLVVCSVVATVGLKYEKRELLLPWITLMVCDLLTECTHLVYLAVQGRVVFNPVVGFIFTMDFFIMCLNMYCLLCVVSHFQSYGLEGSSSGLLRTARPTDQAQVLIPELSSRNEVYTDRKQTLRTATITVEDRCHIPTIPEEH